MRKDNVLPDSVEFMLGIDAMAPNVGTLGCMPGNMDNDQTTRKK